MADTSYYQKVFDVTRLVPEGRVTTYGFIADYLALGSARMVGWALNQCGHDPKYIPAHRVVNRKGELSGRHQFPTPTAMQERLEAVVRQPHLRAPRSAAYRRARVPSPHWPHSPTHLIGLRRFKMC